MTRALAGAGASRRAVPVIQRRPEDRWLVAPVRRVSIAMSGVVLASLLIHAGILLFATLGDAPRDTAPKEITVELVQEPKPDPKPAPKGAEKPAAKAAEARPDAPKAAEKAPELQADQPKAESPKLDQSKVEPPKPEPSKPQQDKPEPAKTEAAKPDLRRTEAEQKPPEPPKASEAKAEPSAEDKLAERETAMKSLQQELDGLKAEQAALQAETQQVAQSEPAAQPPSMLADPKIGGIPPSFAAVALPGLSEIDGIATGYQELVFSQLAKAKGVRRHMGVPGTAGVVFSVDRAGKLVKAAIAHPSGSEALDREALEIVNAAGPFPKPPPGSERTFSANFNFVPQAAP